MSFAYPQLPPPMRIRILWFSFAWWTLSLILVAVVLDRRGTGPGAPLLPTALLNAAPLVAAAAGAVGLAVAWLTMAALGPDPELGGPAATRAWDRIQIGTLVGSAIAELVAIGGLVLVFLGLRMAGFLPFVLASLAVHGLVFFRMQGWIAAEQNRSAAE